LVPVGRNNRYERLKTRKKFRKYLSYRFLLRTGTKGHL
jgi:hypothetical protein